MNETASTKLNRARPIMLGIWFCALCVGVVYGFVVNGDAVRYVLGVVSLVSFAGAVVFWWVIHPFIGFWRRIGTTAAYVASFSALILVGLIAYLNRDFLLGRDLGSNWLLVGLGLPIYGVCVWMEGQIRQQLSARTLVGVAELKNESSDERLISEGIYRLVRHPRYLAVIVGMFGFSLIVNYVGIYVLAILLVPGLYSITVWEEKELKVRFGRRYRDYSSRVPRLIPTAQSLRNYWHGALED